MFSRKPNANPDIDSLFGASTRIQGDVLFTGGLHLDEFESIRFGD